MQRPSRRAGRGDPELPDADQRAKALALLDSPYKAAITKIPEGAAKSRGFAVGQAAAKAVLSVRKDDKSGAVPQYTPGTRPGWRPHPNPVPPNPPIDNPATAAGNVPAVLPQWASVTPFTMAAPWQFRLPPPPPRASTTYAREYDEVKRLGAKNSTV